MFPYGDILVKEEQRKDMLLEAEKERLISEISQKTHPKVGQPTGSVGRPPIPMGLSDLLLHFRRLLSV
jgi:hypothetical protein